MEADDQVMLWVYVICAGVLLAAWYLARPMPWFWRLGFLAAMALLLAGMTLPPEVIREGAGLVSSWWPWSQESDLVTQQTSAWAHLILFALVSAWLCWWRADLGVWVLLGLLVTLSFGTEGLQLLVDGRYASLTDVGINLLGAGIGLVLLWFTPHRSRPFAG
ncbi:VanZ family protein [Ectothiorhodospira variabilis]|uniref:VanZ family protein n=1 Tax=Ectothiorhodospira variabilis TaxID=505694 RepID=UPI001EFAD443|nr:VanZ family protein [Ectothiorhodospira variabilis]MCG5497809.1 VanZ family protein [Ectothiorhodospira variabilis]